MADHIAFFGKGGVGTSTLIANISAALVEAGFRVMQIGCGVKADSCSILNRGRSVPAVYQRLIDDEPFSLDKIVLRGFKDIQLVELGEPKISTGGVAHDIPRIFEYLSRGGLFTKAKPDYVLYDVSGDHSREIYYEQIRQLGAKRYFVVTSADFMSLSSANSIYSSFEQLVEAGKPASFGGLIPNGINSSFEESFVANFAVIDSVNKYSNLC